MNLLRNENERPNSTLSDSGPRSRKKSAVKKSSSVVKRLLVNEIFNENGSKPRL